MQKANFALNSAEEATFETPGLGDVGLPMEVDEISKTVVPTEGFTEVQRANLRNLLPQHIAVFSERPGRTVRITHET